MLMAAFGLGLASLWMSQVASLWMLVVGFFGIRLCGQGALSLGSGHALAMWFERRLGVAEGIRLTVFGLGMASLPAAAALCIDRFGWRTTWPILGLGAAVSVIALVLTVHKDRPEDMGQTLDGDPTPDTTLDPDGPSKEVEAVWGFTLNEALRSPAFWAVVLASMNSAMIGTALLFHVQPLAVSVGMDESSAARLIGTFAVVSTSLFFVAGSLSDRVRPGFVFATVAALISGACLVHVWATGATGLTLAWTMLGIGSALQMTTSAPTLARCFGRAHHGAIRGMQTTVSVAGSAIGPLVLGLSADLSGDFAAGLLGFAAWSVGIGVFALSVSIEPPRS
jgi:MFS family permease